MGGLLRVSPPNERVTTPCILWWGTIHHTGYGQHSFRRGDKTFSIRAHRLIWEECFGEIPEGLVVRHKCDNPPCVNPEHLELGTYGDNNRDRVDRGRDAKKSQTHCVHGHEFTEDNTYVKKNGSRICNTCNRIRSRDRYQQRKKTQCMLAS